MDAIFWIISILVTFVFGIGVGLTIYEKTDGKKMKEEINRQHVWSRTYQKERDGFFDKYCDEMEKNRLYKLWIYEQIRDKRSD